jgi:beta-lactam-binding protein with PASTA domain
MPDLTGWQFASAEAALKKVGIETAGPSFVNLPVAPVDSGDAKPNLVVRPGEVLTQSPSAGTRVDQSTIVKLTVVR